MYTHFANAYVHIHCSYVLGFWGEVGVGFKVYCQSLTVVPFQNRSNFPLSLNNKKTKHL
jgi:hypothetical protein